MKMCDIIKELRALQRCGDKSEQTMAKRMLNNLYGEQHNKEEIERITLLQYLKTFDCSYNGVYLTVKDNWYGIPCSVDLGHFNVKTDTLFPTEDSINGVEQIKNKCHILVKDDDATFAPALLYKLYIEKAERSPISMCYNIVLTSKYYFDTDSIKGDTNGNND